MKTKAKVLAALIAVAVMSLVLAVPSSVQKKLLLKRVEEKVINLGRHQFQHVYHAKRWWPNAGQQHGPYVVYYVKSGLKRTEGEYRDGLPYGIDTEWDKDGRVESQNKYDGLNRETRSSPPWWNDAKDQQIAQDE